MKLSPQEKHQAIEAFFRWHRTHDDDMTGEMRAFAYPIMEMLREYPIHEGTPPPEPLDGMLTHEQISEAVADYRNDMEYYIQPTKERAEAILPVLDQIERLTHALAWYANDGNYEMEESKAAGAWVECSTWEYTEWDFEPDCGDVARGTLAGTLKPQMPDWLACWNQRFGAWSEETYGPSFDSHGEQVRGGKGPMVHLLRELTDEILPLLRGETLAPKDAEKLARVGRWEYLLEEYADVMHLVLDGVRREGYSLHDLARAMDQKLTKNMARTWGAPDAEGVVEHVR